MEKEEERVYLSSEQFSELKRQELLFINQNFSRPKQRENMPRPLVGLSLSGGGIGSAIINLGVLQAFAKRGLFQKIDYLSTVSGGGYIGSSLTWFFSEQTQKDFSNHYYDPKSDLVFGACNHNFPYGTDQASMRISGINSFLQNNLIEHIRQHSSYLAPRGYYSLLSLVTVALRTAMLSLITWVPLISLIMLFIIKININSFEKNTIPIAFEVIGSLGLLSFVGFTTIGIIMACIISIKTNEGYDDESYKYRLVAEKIASRLLNIAIVMTGIYLIAWIGTEFSTETITEETNTKEKTYSKLGAYVISFFSTITGIFTGLKDIFKPDSQKINTIRLPLAAGLVAFGILLFSYQLAYAVFLKLDFTIAGVTIYLSNLLYIGVVIALTACVRINLNDISISRFYRDRLKEAFMPDAKSSEPDNLENLSKEAYLKDMCKISNEIPYPGPYHIINSKIILIDSKEKKYSRRGGDSFILSPLYCGSSSTGWRTTSNYLKGKLTLATAMAISGVQVKSNLGASGQRLVKNRLISFVLEILNLRLGFWLPTPNPLYKSRKFFYPGNFLQSAWYSIKSLTNHNGYHEHAGCVQVSDSGQFENLGIYELIRRELDLIIISDTTADANFTFSDFRTALHLAETELDVEIYLDDDEKFSMLLPKEGEKNSFPHRSYLSGTIRYNNNKKGRFIYLKSNIILRQSLHHFFDESQFESYRDFGYTNTCEMLENCNLAPLESRIKKERRSDNERRKTDLGFSNGNHRSASRRINIRRTA